MVVLTGVLAKKMKREAAALGERLIAPSCGGTVVASRDKGIRATRTDGSFWQIAGAAVRLHPQNERKMSNNICVENRAAQPAYAAWPRVPGFSSAGVMIRWRSNSVARSAVTGRLK
jgi:hypothetical protein